MTPKLTLFDIDGKAVGSANITDLQYCEEHARTWSIAHSITDKFWLRLSSNMQKKSIEHGQDNKNPMRGKTKVTWVISGTPRQWRDLDKAEA